MDYCLPIIPYLKLKFVLQAEQVCTLPRIKGSMLRGAFGSALKRTVCIQKKQESCQSCLFRSQCTYTKIFETYVEGTPPPFLSKLPTSPRPYIIDAFDQKTEYAQGDTFSFTLTLLGNIGALYPYIIYSISLMAKRGLSSKRLPFQLHNVYWINPEQHSLAENTFTETLIYKGETESLCAQAIPTHPHYEDSEHDQVQVRFLTPTRLKYEDQYIMDFSFRLLVFKMLRRLLELAHFYAPENEIDWHFHPYLVQANEVAIMDPHLKWQDWHRYSSRQNTKMEIGGFIGDILLAGNINGFTPLLLQSQVLHIGKGTSFGLGKIRVTITE